VNKLRTAFRISRLSALCLCGLLYSGAIVWLGFYLQQERLRPAAFTPQPVRLSFAQVALQSAVEPPPPEPLPEPPDPEPVEEMTPEADIAPEKAEEEPPPEAAPDPIPEPEPVQEEVEAAVSQEAAAPEVPPVERDLLLAWVQQQIEQEKYYPPSARRAGYEGRFRLRVALDESGTVVDAAVLNGRGHPLLRRSLEKILDGLPGRRFGQPLPEAVELPFEFEFRLQ
jgi:TonB family protein